jgi:hypothetical protein
MILFRSHSHASSSFLMICFIMINPRLLTISCVFTACLFSSCQNRTSFFYSYQQVLVFAVLCGIAKSKKAWKVFFNFIRSSKPFGNIVYFLRNWYALSYQGFNLLYVSANVALIQIKEKTSQCVSYVKTIVH